MIVFVVFTVITEYQCSHFNFFFFNFYIVR